MVCANVALVPPGRDATCVAADRPAAVEGHGAAGGGAGPAWTPPWRSLGETVLPDVGGLPRR
eukprot:13746854-Alexandrium_andersonii.AAC.1